MNKDSNLIFEAYRNSKESNGQRTWGNNERLPSETSEILEDIISYITPEMRASQEFQQYEKLVRLIINKNNTGFIVVKCKSQDVYGRSGYLIKESFTPEQLAAYKKYNLFIDKEKTLKFYSLSNSPEYAPGDPNIGFRVYGDRPEILDQVFHVSMYDVDYNKSYLLTLGVPTEDLDNTNKLLDI